MRNFILLIICISVFICNCNKTSDSPTETKPLKAGSLQQSVEVTSPSNLTKNTNIDIQKLVQSVIPSIVTIKTSNGTGSGFIISPDGLVLTNAHVTDEVMVDIIFKDGSKESAKLLKIDNLKDISLLQILSKKNYPFMKIGDAENITVGQRIIAIGSPYGLSNTITEGVVSAIRDNPTFQRKEIQHSAPINPGNSGGPLINLQGEVLGINTYIFTKSSTQFGSFHGLTVLLVEEQVSQGMNFAVASDELKHFINSGYNANTIIFANKKEEFFQKISQTIPDWEEIIKDKRLEKYIEVEDDTLKVKRRDILLASLFLYNAEPIINILQGFKDTVEIRGKWKVINKTQDMTIYYDEDSIKKSNDKEIGIQIRIEEIKDNKGTGKNIIYFAYINCEGKSHQICQASYDFSKDKNSSYAKLSHDHHVWTNGNLTVINLTAGSHSSIVTKQINSEDSNLIYTPLCKAIWHK